METKQKGAQSATPLGVKNTSLFERKTKMQGNQKVGTKIVKIHVVGSGLNSSSSGSTSTPTFTFKAQREGSDLDHVFSTSRSTPTFLFKAKLEAVPVTIVNDSSSKNLKKDDVDVNGDLKVKLVSANACSRPLAFMFRAQQKETPLKKERKLKTF